MISRRRLRNFKKRSRRQKKRYDCVLAAMLLLYLRGSSENRIIEQKSFVLKYSHLLLPSSSNLPTAWRYRDAVD